MSIGTFAIGTGGIGSSLARAVPQVTITSPSSTITSSTVTAEWTWTSAVGRPAASHRAILRTASSGQILEDSGEIAGDGSSYSFSFLLQGFSQYAVEIQVDDGLDTGSSTVTFTSEQSAVSAYEDEPRVGSVYEVAINGVGFMLADRPDGELRYARRSVTLEPERFATGETPFSEAVERYTLLGFNDWTGGAGQKHLNRPTSGPSRYWDSEGINPFEPGEISLLNAVALDIPSGYTNQLAVVAGTDLYVLTDDTELTHAPSPGASETAFAVHASAVQIQSLTSDGEYWYATDGADIYRNNAAASASAAWSTVNVSTIAWCSDRLVGFITTGTPAVTTFSPSGTEEVAGGRFLYPGADLQGLTSGDGYAWWGVNRGRGGQVYAWQLGNNDVSAFIALSLPHGQSVQSLFFYLGNVFVAALVRGRDGVEETKIYRCVPSEGKLTPELVLTLDSGQMVHWAGRDRFVAFTWDSMTEGDDTGIGVIDLSTGGYAKWFTSGTPNEPGALVAWAGEFAFTVNTEGLYTVTDAEDFVASGWLVTSSSDLESSVQKVFDRITVNSKSLVGTIGLEWSSDTLESWNEIGTLQGDGSTVGIFDLALQVSRIGFRVTLTEGAAGSPELESIMVQLHPLSFADQLIVLPLNCGDRVAGLNGAEIEGSRPGRGNELARWVEGLIPSRVRFQDIDWPETGEAILAEAVSAETDTQGVFDPQQNRRVSRHVVVLTLRRRL